MTERNCYNVKCGKPLIRSQKKYCSMACQWESRRNPQAAVIWELRRNDPKISLRAISEATGTDEKYVNQVLYSYPSRPADLPKKKYKPRKPKPKEAAPVVEEPLPPGKYGKHVAPGWLWNLDGGVDTLEKKCEHLGKRKRKLKK